MSKPRAKSPFDLIRRVFTFYLTSTLEVRQATGITGEGGGVHYPMSSIRAWLESRVRGWPFPAIHRTPECRALLAAAGPGGGLLEAVYFRRIGDDDPTNKALVWEVQVRQLVLAVDADRVPRASPKGACGPRDHHIVIRRPRRRAIVSAVARTLHYPNDLIALEKMSVEQVAEYLGIRRGFQLVATYGRFRAKHTQ